MTDDHCVFCKIIAGKIPSKKVHEDELVYAFHDINPWAPVHFLIVPKAHIPSMAQVGPEHAALLAHMMTLAPKLAAQEGCGAYPEGGFRIVVNTGDEGGQADRDPLRRRQAFAQPKGAAQSDHSG